MQSVPRCTYATYMSIGIYSNYERLFQSLWQGLSSGFGQAPEEGRGDQSGEAQCQHGQGRPQSRQLRQEGRARTKDPGCENGKMKNIRHASKHLDMAKHKEF